MVPSVVIKFRSSVLDVYCDRYINVKRPTFRLQSKASSGPKIIVLGGNAGSHENRNLQ